MRACCVNDCVVRRQGAVERVATALRAAVIEKPALAAACISGTRPPTAANVRFEDMSLYEMNQEMLALQEQAAEDRAVKKKVESLIGRALQSQDPAG
eukprot:62075-Prymnesium_polylepis.1